MTGYRAVRTTNCQRSSRHSGSGLLAELAAAAEVLELPAQVAVVVAGQPASWWPGRCRCCERTHKGVVGTGWYPYCLWNWRGDRGGGVCGGDTPVYLLSAEPHSSEKRPDWLNAVENFQQTLLLCR